jgi:hypothetical protein
MVQWKEFTERPGENQLVLIIFMIYYLENLEEEVKARRGRSFRVPQMENLSIHLKCRRFFCFLACSPPAILAPCPDLLFGFYSVSTSLPSFLFKLFSNSLLNGLAWPGWWERLACAQRHEVRTTRQGVFYAAQQPFLPSFGDTQRHTPTARQRGDERARRYD